MVGLRSMVVLEIIGCDIDKQVKVNVSSFRTGTGHETQ